MLRPSLISCLVIVTCLCSCGPDLPKDVAAAYKDLPAALDYNIHVKPVLSDKCFSCHGPDKAKQKAGLRLDLPASAFGELPESPGKVAIRPGNPGGSELFRRILSPDAAYRMPTPASHLNLSAKDKATLIKWIRDGAVYKPQWAFVKPVLPAIPTIPNKDLSVHNGIDNFILARLGQEHLPSSPEAGKEVLLRRLYLDLTGLPPTIPQIDAYLTDQRPDAYERQVDWLLNSRHYGEKMAVDWLDLARFADSHGYTVDRLRDMSPYRDWVIDAFNRNLPYDKFIEWQLAGDLETHPSREMLIATAFNRNHPQNMEGGIVEEEFQTEYAIDRTNTFGTAFLGISVGCAKCHDHKYDPVSQKNYYELYSFFNNVKEAGQISFDDAMPSPTLLLPDPQREKIIAFIDSGLRDQEKKIQVLKDAAAPDCEKWVRTGAGASSLLTQKIPMAGLQARYDFENGKGTMKREMGQAGDPPVFTTRAGGGKALLLNGDSWLDLGQTGVFRRSDPFSIGIRVFIPGDLKEGVLFHKGFAERLYNFRGYHCYLRDNRLECSIAHVAPSNAITKISKDPVPRDQWIQLTMTYDGSSRAAGLHLYMNGKEMPMETTMDQLTKDILFLPQALGFTGNRQPGLQIGGWWRGRGFKGGQVDDILVYDRVLTPFECNRLGGDPSARPGPADLRAYYCSVADPRIRAAEKELQRLRTTLADSTENIPELMIMQESAKGKQTHILIRGNYDAPGEAVSPNVPPAIMPWPKDYPRNRLGLARWLVHPDNPLTARVAVNRIWQNFFGTGLVKTTEDLGNQGEMPSHPELLDWLAVNFRGSGWDLKKLIRLIVVSATYRQDARAGREAQEKDPENRLLSHGPAYRMTAEMIRDNALMASGLLNEAIGGKSVKPYQPGGLWEINNTSYTADTGSAVYRRSLYVVVKRSVPNPTLATFDGPSRSYCIVRRQPTNTPLQALVTLNDPTFVEAAAVMGQQMARAPDPRAALVLIYRKLTGLTPTPPAIDLLMNLRDLEWKKFREHPVKARGWLHAGQTTAPVGSDSLLVAAGAVVASTILNSDASITKR